MKLYLNTPPNYRSGIFNIQRDMNLSVYGTNSIYDAAVKGKPKDQKALDEAFQQGYKQGLPDGFLAPDIAVFEGESIQPTLTTNSPLDLGGSNAINKYARDLEISETIAAIEELDVKIKPLDEGLFQGTGPLKGKKRALELKLERLNNDPDFNLTKSIAQNLVKAPRLDTHLGMVHGTAVTLTDDFSVVNRKSIHFLQKHGVNPIERVVDLRKDPIPKEELTSSNYNIRDLLAPPRLMPHRKKVVELHLDDIITEEVKESAILALTNKDVMEITEQVVDNTTLSVDEATQKVEEAREAFKNANNTFKDKLTELNLSEQKAGELYDTFNDLNDKEHNIKSEIKYSDADSGERETLIYYLNENEKALEEDIVNIDDTLVKIDDEIASLLPAFLSLDDGVKLEALQKKRVDAKKIRNTKQEGLIKGQIKKQLTESVKESYIKFAMELGHENAVEILNKEEEKMNPSVGSSVFSTWAEEALVREYEKNKPSLHGGSNFSKKIINIFGKEYHKEFQKKYGDVK